MAQNAIHTLNETYNAVVYELLHDSTLRADASTYVSGIFTQLLESVSRKHTTLLHNSIVAYGELLSTYVFTNYLKQEGISNRVH